MKSLADLQIKTKIQEVLFYDIEMDLMIRLDAFDNVITVLEEETAPGPDGNYKYPNHWAYVRDATNALPLADRTPPDHQDLQAINAFLRALNVVKGIAYVVHQKSLQQPDNAHYQAAQQALKNYLLNYYDKVFASDTIADPKSHFKNLEANFHTEILSILDSLNLTRGLKQSKDYAGLLEHYRNLASLMTPAKSFITKVKHRTPIGDVIYIDEAHPVTKKTDAQREQIALMLEVKPATENPDSQHFHSVAPLAFQEPSSIFAPLLMQDDTALGAQTRYTIAPTVKNAFAVINKIIFPDGTEAKTSYLRTASLGYIGPGETFENCTNYATESIKQLLAAAGSICDRHDLYINLLMTNHAWNKQNKMIAISRSAALETGTNVSVEPINLFGVSYPMEISPEVQTLARKLHATLPPATTEYRNFLNKRLRTENAADIINIINSGADSIAAVGCASAQDRSGSALEIAIIRWTYAEFLKRGIDVKEQEIAEARALGCHNAMLTTLTVPGSPGMKKDSIPHYFSPAVTQAYYRDSADTNKGAQIDATNAAKMLALAQPTTPEDLEKNFTQNLEKINQATNMGSIMHALINWANAATHYQKSKPSAGIAGLVSSFFSYANKGTWQDEGRGAITEIVQTIATSDQNDSVAKFADLLKEMDEQRERVASVYPYQQNGTVYTEIDEIIEVATKKLNQLHPLEEKSSVIEFKR
ncbi:MAG: hypothetical protein V4501_08370 [Pseudomonadota bacterium]